MCTIVFTLDIVVYNFQSTAYIMAYHDFQNMYISGDNRQTMEEYNFQSTNITMIKVKSSHLWRQPVDRCLPIVFTLDIVEYNFQSTAYIMVCHDFQNMYISGDNRQTMEGYNFLSTAYIMVFTCQTFSRNVVIHYHISGDNR